MNFKRINISTLNNKLIDYKKNLKQRFIGNIIKGLFGSFMTEPTSQKMYFNTTIKNESEFRNSLQICNELIFKKILNITKTNITEGSQVQNYNFDNLNAEKNIKFNINSKQETSIIDLTKLNIKNTTDILVEMSSDVINQIQTDFGNQVFKNLNQSVTNDKTNNLLSSIFSLASNSTPTVNSVINVNTNLQNIIKQDFETIISQLTKIDEINNIINKIQTSFNQQVNFNIKNLTSKNLDIKIDVEQTSKFLFNSIIELNFISKIFSKINNSQIYRIDNSVINVSKDEGEQMLKNKTKDEGISDVVNSFGTSFAMASLMPIIGLITILIIVIILFRRKNIKGQGNDYTQNNNNLFDPGTAEGIGILTFV